MTETGARIIAIAARSWWIVALTTVAAAIAAYLLTGTEPARYVATAGVAIDTAAVSAQPRVPKPDAVIALAQKPEFAEKAGLPEGASLRAYATGNPQDRFFVAVTHPDKAIAEKSAVAAGEQVIEAVREAMSQTLSDQRALAEANQRALDRLGEPEEGDELTAFFRWSVEKEALAQESLVRVLENAYRYDGAVTVATAAATRSAKVSALGGALAGFVLGLVLVAIREMAARRAA